MILAVLILAVFSGLAFWKPNAPIFMLLSGVSLITGLEWYDYYTNELGLTIALVLVCYALMSAGFAFRFIFYRAPVQE